MADLLLYPVLLLLAAVIAVPIFKRLGLGSVLGYLVAGLVVGPYGTALIDHPDELLHYAELGVVFLLFVIGLELQVNRLKAMRVAVFGAGTSQVVVTAGLLCALLWFLGETGAVVLVAAGALALSSTALALQLLAENRQLHSPHGRFSLGILLFQDLAVIPMLAVLPLLAPGEASMSGAQLAWSAGKALALIVGLIIGGRYLLRFALAAIARYGGTEVFTAAALLIVTGVALLADLVGLSMALGAFIAGVLLADSEYRLELEGNIQPFKGLLLGLFFMAVGMTVELPLLASEWPLILALVLALVTGKFAVLFAVGRAFSLPTREAVLLGVTLAQAGEFGFVLFAAAGGLEILPPDIEARLTLLVALSLIVTPVALRLLSTLSPAPTVDDAFDAMDESEPGIIIAGFGRFGQIPGRILNSLGYHFTALDISQDQVELVRRFGNKVFYGDVSRLELLQSAGAAHARILLLAIDDPEASIATAKMARKHFPHLKIMARARNRAHAHALMEADADWIERETLRSSVHMTRRLLMEMGLSRGAAERAAERFVIHDEAMLHRQFELRDDQAKMVAASRQGVVTLERILREDENLRGENTVRE